MNTSKSGLSLFIGSKNMTTFEKHLNAALLSLVGDDINDKLPSQQNILRSNAKKFLWLYLLSNLDRIVSELGKDNNRANYINR
jgi:hypothetical protein